MLVIRHDLFSPTDVLRCIDKTNYVCYLRIIGEDQFMIPIKSMSSSMLHQYPNIGD